MNLINYLILKKYQNVLINFSYSFFIILLTLLVLIFELLITSSSFYLEYFDLIVFIIFILLITIKFFVSQKTFKNNKDNLELLRFDFVFNKDVDVKLTNSYTFDYSFLKGQNILLCISVFFLYLSLSSTKLLIFSIILFVIALLLKIFHLYLLIKQKRYKKSFIFYTGIEIILYLISFTLFLVTFDPEKNSDINIGYYVIPIIIYSIIYAFILIKIDGFRYYKVLKDLNNNENN